MTAAFRASLTSTCDSRPPMSGLDRSDRISRAASARARRRRTLPSRSRRRDGQAVDDRQVEAGVRRTVLVDDRALIVDQIQPATNAGRGRSAARSWTTTSMVDGSTRRRAASFTHGEASSRRAPASQVAPQDVLSVRARSGSAFTASLESCTFAPDGKVIDLQRARVRDDGSPPP